MAILIKNTDLPVDCEDCLQACVDGQGFICGVFDDDTHRCPTDGRPDWCPLVEVIPPDEIGIVKKCMTCKHMSDEANSLTGYCEGCIQRAGLIYTKYERSEDE